MGHVTDHVTDTGVAAGGTGRIVVDQLTKVFRGNVRAVDALSFTVEPGSVTGFLGPNGAGKTTTLRMVLGLVRPTSGSATINGVAYQRLPDPLRQVGAALEASSFHPARTGRTGHCRRVSRFGGRWGGTRSGCSLRPPRHRRG